MTKSPARSFEDVSLASFVSEILGPMAGVRPSNKALAILQAIDKNRSHSNEQHGADASGEPARPGPTEGRAEAPRMELPHVPGPQGLGRGSAGGSPDAAPHLHEQVGSARVRDEARDRSDAAAVAALIDRLDQITIEQEKKRAEQTRAYIGASGIGNPCLAYQALSLRGFGGDMPDAQLLRIFNEGKRLEPFIAGSLAATGVKVREVDPATGEQYHFNTLGGHVAANLDGMVWKGKADPNHERPTHTLEIKSMNRDLFKRFAEKGLAVSHPDYVDQMQLGMGLSGIAAGLMLAYCKDNSKFHAEFIYFNKARFDELMARATSAMFASAAEKTESFDCTRCFKRTACKTGMTMTADKHCRQCRHAYPDITRPGKTWNCRLHGGSNVSVPCSDFEVYKVIAIKKP